MKIKNFFIKTVLVVFFTSQVFCQSSLQNLLDSENFDFENLNLDDLDFENPETLEWLKNNFTDFELDSDEIEELELDEDFDSYSDLSFTGSAAEFTPVDNFSVEGNRFLYDDVDLLTDDEEIYFENFLSGLSKTYGIGIYMVFVYDYTVYASDVESAAEKIFDNYNFGLGERQNSLQLLLSMEDRSYDIDVHGHGKVAFPENRRDVLIDAFAYYFKNDDWARGLDAYLSSVYSYLEMDKGNGIDYETLFVAVEKEERLMTIKFAVGIAVIFSVIFAFIRLSAEKRKMKNVRQAVEANSYIDKKTGIQITQRNDIYKYSTSVTRTIQTSSGGGGGSGGHSHSSGHF